MRWLVLALAVSQWPGSGLEVRDEGVRQGYAVRVDCVGTGVTCTRSGSISCVKDAP